MRTNRIALAAVAAIAAAAGCGRGEPAREAKGAAAPAIAGRPVVLPSGHRVLVQGAAPLRFTQGPPALMVKYVTAVKMTDTAELAAEAAEVFAQFRKAAERRRFNGFVASAKETHNSVVEQVSTG